MSNNDEYCLGAAHARVSNLNRSSTSGKVVAPSTTLIGGPYTPDMGGDSIPTNIETAAAISHVVFDS